MDKEFQTGYEFLFVSDGDYLKKSYEEVYMTKYSSH
jgi:hypothetical protein